MGLDVEIRAPLPTDGGDVSRLVYDNAAFFGHHPRFLRQLMYSLLDDPRTETWVAVTSHVVGFIALHLGEKPTNWHTASLRVFIAPDARDQGVGERLITEALAWADENSIARITATPYMRGPLGLYSSIFERHGFVKEGVMRAAVREGDELLDVAMLARVTA